MTKYSEKPRAMQTCLQLPRRYRKQMTENDKKRKRHKKKKFRNRSFIKKEKLSYKNRKT